jgi:hypothetical protein
VKVGHQQREAEVAEHPFNGSFPELVAPFKLLLMLPNLCGDTLNPIVPSEALLLLLLESPTTFL